MVVPEYNPESRLVFAELGITLWFSFTYKYMAPVLTLHWILSGPTVKTQHKHSKKTWLMYLASHIHCRVLVLSAAHSWVCFFQIPGNWRMPRSLRQCQARTGALWCDVARMVPLGTALLRVLQPTATCLRTCSRCYRHAGNLHKAVLAALTCWKKKVVVYSTQPCCTATNSKRSSLWKCWWKPCQHQSLK